MIVKSLAGKMFPHIFALPNRETIALNLRKKSKKDTSRSRAAVARRAHNPKVRGSIPLFATVKEKPRKRLFLF